MNFHNLRLRKSIHKRHLKSSEHLFSNKGCCRRIYGTFKITLNYSDGSVSEMMQVSWFLLFSQVASLFKAKDGQGEASTVPDPGQPLSYAEFVVQSKNRGLQGAAHGSEKQISAAQCRNDAAGQNSVNTAGSGSVSTSFTDSGKPETEQQGPAEVPTEDQTKEEGQSFIPPHLLGSGNSIIVSPRQVCITYVHYLSFSYL